MKESDELIALPANLALPSHFKNYLCCTNRPRLNIHVAALKINIEANILNITLYNVYKCIMYLTIYIKSLVFLDSC